MPSDPTIVAAMWGFIGAAVGAAVGAFATLLVAQRSLRAEHVIGERQKWREKVRGLAIKCAKSGPLEEDFWIELAVNTNPYKEFDAQLVLKAHGLRGRPLDVEDRQRIVVDLARLLKHDWERAKIESSWRPWCASERAQEKCLEDHLRLKWQTAP